MKFQKLLRARDIRLMLALKSIMLSLLQNLPSSLMKLMQGIGEIAFKMGT
jgi:hypothetical protein